MVGDLTATIRDLPDTAAVEAGESIFLVANRSALDLSPKEIEITIPASNLRLHNEPEFTMNVSSPANYSGAKLAVRAVGSSSTGRYFWGRAFAQSVYTIADYDRGVFYLAQAHFANVSEWLIVESLERPFEESWYGSGGDVEGPSGDGDKNNVGAIAGGVVRGVAAIVLIAVAVWLWRMKKRTRNATREEVPWQQQVEEYVPITGRAEMDLVGVDVVRNELDGVARRERVHEMSGR